MALKGKVKMISENKPVLGINGLGRIGKLTLWHHISRKYFSDIIINIGRKVGTKIEDIALYIEKDSTYGTLQRYIYGHKEKRIINKYRLNPALSFCDIPKFRFCRFAA